MSLKSVAIVGCVGIPAKYGGYETLAEYLTIYLSKQHRVTVFCSTYAYPLEDRIKTYHGADLKYIPLRANGIQSIFYDTWSLILAVRNHDVVILLGISAAFIIPILKLFRKTKFIIHVDGVEWRRGKWKGLAKSFLKFSENVGAKSAYAIIADNEGIRKYVKSAHNRDSVLIEYGADHTRRIAISSETLEEYPFLVKPYAFSVCRIEPENNIDMILQAFEILKTKNLIIVGNWNYSLYGRNLQEKYKDTPNLFLLDPIYDQNMLNEFRSNCELYIHGHSAGGTNPSLVEAMYLQLPVIAFDVIFNRATTEEKALFFKSAEYLVNQVNNLTEENRISIADQLYEVAKRRYKWEVIAKKYAELF